MKHRIKKNSVDEEDDTGNDDKLVRTNVEFKYFHLLWDVTNIPASHSIEQAITADSNNNGGNNTDADDATLSTTVSVEFYLLKELEDKIAVKKNKIAARQEKKKTMLEERSKLSKTISDDTSSLQVSIIYIFPLLYL
jgi:HD superfamily phosphohydrolase